MVKWQIKEEKQKEVYFFPEYGINIEADSLEDAQEKLKTILSNKLIINNG